MEESSLRFWIIPVICLVVVIGIFASVLAYQFNVAMPNAVVEMEELRKMSCDQIKEKNAVNRYWSKTNSEYGNNKAKGCTDAEMAIKQAEQKRIDKLLADPNSLESLSRDLKKFQDLYDSYQELYQTHSSEAKILKQNVTDFENQINRIKIQLSQEYGVN
ncbi:hypothetical protein [Nitrosopumilus ureiphilus]|uniref:Uncharacterized protein n=1 Tax=Nitrosopumilus ureiphilus TaxID=1470067 RepID=A0A7D5R4Z5_9ARCH|nr:hypothetical protein [Nitrosopumilus ureiphilus]QLH05837.1 hypothetical protein C5F50_01135 [Nitrosopumilus ureiphilus]